MTKIINTLLFILLCSFTFAQTSNPYVKTSMDFLELLKARQNTDEIAGKIASFTEEELINGLTTDDQRLAFWVNIYNGYIMRILDDAPELYEDRRKFFKEKYIDIAGRKMAFADIEHGIIRHSQFEYGVGYITNIFAPCWERKLRVKKRDFRIHFALNCGAKDCPPVAIYDDTKVNEQFAESTKRYLQRTAEVNEEENAVYATSLFNWFRGDFGGKKGAKKILVYNGVIDNLDYDLKFLGYDWTLYLHNFIEL